MHVAGAWAKQDEGKGLGSTGNAVLVQGDVFSSSGKDGQISGRRPFTNIWSYYDNFHIFVLECSQGTGQKSERTTILATGLGGWKQSRRLCVGMFTV